MHVTFDDKDRVELANLVGHWVASVEHPTKPMFGSASGGPLLSPRDLEQEVRAGTVVGEQYLTELANLVAEVAREEVLKRRFT